MQRIFLINHKTLFSNTQNSVAVPRTNPIYLLCCCSWRSPISSNKLNDEKPQTVHHFYTESILFAVTLFCLVFNASFACVKCLNHYMQSVHCKPEKKDKQTQKS